MEISHASLRMSPALRRVLLQNPFHDYSQLTRLKINAPYDLQELDCLTALEELHVFLDDGE